MRPLLKGALAAAVLAALGQPQAPKRSPSQSTAAPEASVSGNSKPMPGQRLCPTGSLPLNKYGQCLPVSDQHDGRTPSRQQRIAAAQRAPLNLRVRSAADSIPLLPGKPLSLESYQLPLEPALDVELLGTMELDGRDVDHTLGPHLIIEGEPGAEVKLLGLAGETEKAQVLLVGELEGVTVALRHTMAGGNGDEHVISIYGRLNNPGVQVVSGAKLSPGTVLGHIAEADDDDVATLWLQLRREREDTSTVTLLSRLTRQVVSIPLDPRNVLPLAPN